jgi:glutaminyl-peptide cyclotransferase
VLGRSPRESDLHMSSTRDTLTVRPPRPLTDSPGRLAIFALLVFSCSRDVPAVKEFDGAAGLRYIEQQLAFGPRIPGTAGHEQMAEWLDSTLRSRADTVIVQDWNHVTLKRDTLRLRNFIARFNPAAERRILYLAHWDTRPASGPDSALDFTKPVPGANDGASGVAVLLGVADRLKAERPGIGVDLLFVDGEDYGIFKDSVDVLIGSTYYAKNQIPGPRPEFAVLFDMVADKDLKIFMESYSSIAAPQVVDRVWTTAEGLGYTSYFDRRARHSLMDDHVPLQRAGISAIDVVDFDYGPSHAYWHSPSDTIDKVSGESLKIVGDVALAVIRSLR